MKHAVVTQLPQKDLDALLEVESQRGEFDERQNPRAVQQFARVIQKAHSLRVGQPPLGFAARVKALHLAEWLTSQDIYTANAGLKKDPC